MPKCVPMTRSSELRPLTLLLYVVPVTLMELLRRWGSGTTSGSGGGGGGGGGGGTGTHTHVFAMQECKGLQHLGWLHFTELAILFKIPKNDPWLSSGHTSLQILSHPGHSSPKSLKRSRLTSLSCLEMFKKLLRFLNQKMVSPTNWKNWETVSEEVVIMHRNMSRAKPSHESLLPEASNETTVSGVSILSLPIIWPVEITWHKMWMGVELP